MTWRDRDQLRPTGNLATFAHPVCSQTALRDSFVPLLLWNFFVPVNPIYPHLASFPSNSHAAKCA
jgi:hypothetical protein